MKHVVRLTLYLIALVFMSLFISSCGGGDNGGGDETPNAPSNVQAVLLDGNIRVSWEHDNKNVVGFSLYRNEGSPIGENAQNAEKIGETKADVKFYIDDASLDPDKQYSYSVAAKGAKTESARVAIEEPIQPAPRTGDFRVRALFGGEGGKGTIKSGDNAINCTEPGGTKCSSDFQTGTTVTLEASPTTGSEFVGWQGVDCSGTGPCNVSVSTANDPNNDSIIEVTALFDQTGYLLSVDKRGTGTGTIVSTPSGIDCGTDCEEAYLIPAQGNAATKVGFSSVTVADGSLFNGWGGACPTAVATSSCVVTMDADKTVEAFFSKPAADSYTVGEGETLNQAAPGVLVNDVALAGGVELDTDPVQDPENGTLTLEADGSFTYSHDGSNTTSDSFSYRVSDGRGNEAEISVSLSITPSDDPPVAEDDVYAVAEDVTKNVPAADGVLKNDSDEDGDELSAELRTNVTRGTLTLKANGSFIYTPNTNFSGTDSFTYVAKAGGQESAPATVTITVSDSNDPPVAANGTATVLEDGSVEITLNATDNDSPALTYEIVAQPSNGTLTGTGKIRTYNPSPNLNGTDSFTFKANDGSTDSNTATVNISVTAVNDAPSFVISDNTVTSTAGAGAQTVPDFATSLNKGPANEASQSFVGFELERTDTDGGLTFATDPAISPAGVLTYQASSAGSATFRAVLKDSGGTANGGVDTSSPRPFTITVNAAPAVNSVTITPSNPGDINVSSTVQLTATVNSVGGASQAVTWTSSDTDVATVNADGLVTGVGGGTATITATSDFDNTKSDAVDVTVNLAPAINSVTVTPDNLGAIAVSGTVQLTATVDAVGGADETVTWTSSDTDIATVNASGLVTGVGEGTATITATSTVDGTKSDSVEVTVNPAPAVNSVTVTPEDPDSIDVGNTVQLTATVSAVGGASQAVTWTSSDTNVATVNASGLVTGAGEGVATITATSDFDNTKSDAVDVTVNLATMVESVEIEPNDPEVDMGDTETLEAKVETSGNAPKTVRWTSTDRTVATVNRNGVVRGVKPGEASISATSTYDASKRDTVSVTVNGVLSVAISPATVRTLSVGDKVDLTATVETFGDASDKVTWSSSNEDIVSVKNSGEIKAEGRGEATIVATSQFDDSQSASINIEVEENVPVPENDAYTTPEDQTLFVASANGVLANDGTGDVSAVLESSTANGTLFLEADGSFDYQPVPNFFGEDSFSYRLQRGDSLSAPALVTLNVSPVNDFPITSGIEDVTLAPSVDSYVVDLYEAFDDIEDADEDLRFFASASNGNIIDVNSSYIDDGQLVLVMHGRPGSSNLIVRAFDTENAFVDASFTMTVTP